MNASLKFYTFTARYFGKATRPKSVNGNISELNVNFKALISLAKAHVQTPTDYGSPLFSTFFNANHIVLLNNFFSRNFFKVYFLKIL